MAYGFRIHKLGRDDFRLSWVVDHHYRNSRLRFPRGHTRDTDYKGAVRFAKRHKLEIPERAAALGDDHGN